MGPLKTGMALGAKSEYKPPTIGGFMNQFLLKSLAALTLLGSRVAVADGNDHFVPHPCWECTKPVFDPTYGRPTLDPDKVYPFCTSSEIRKGKQVWISNGLYVINKYKEVICEVRR